MRVLFVTWAWGSHFNPMVPLGWALRSAGHEVMVASHPAFAPTITAAGLPALPAGEHRDLGEILQDTLTRSGWYANRHRRRRPGRQVQPDGTDRDSGSAMRRGITVLRIAADSAEAMADDTVRFADRWQPDAVVYEPFGLLGPLLAARLDVPAARLLWTVDFLSTIGDVEQELLGDLATRIGATRINALGDVTLDPWPVPWPASHGSRRQPMRYVPYNGPAAEPAWLRRPKRRPRICVTWGTSLAGLGLNDDLLAPAVVHALGRHDVETVVAVVDSQRALFGVLPGNVVHIGRVPLDQLLPSCDAIVHQGGGGTTMTAVKNGLPQFVLPTLPDTTFNAEHVAGTGAGTYLPDAGTQTEMLSARLDEFLAGLDGYREKAAQLQADHLAMPGPAEVVPMLERGL